MWWQATQTQVLPSAYCRTCWPQRRHHRSRFAIFQTPWQTVRPSHSAGERALAGGTSTRQAIEMVKAFRKTNTTTPVLVGGYLNWLKSSVMTSLSAFVKMLGLTVFWWLIYRRKKGDFTQKLANSAMNEIFLLAPTTFARTPWASAKTWRWFIYYVSVKGVTGSKHWMPKMYGRARASD